jgi:hypothetical protein
MLFLCGVLFGVLLQHGVSKQRFGKNMREAHKLLVQAHYLRYGRWPE